MAQMQVGDWVIARFFGCREICVQVSQLSVDDNCDWRVIIHGMRNMVLQPRRIEAQNCVAAGAARDRMVAQHVKEAVHKNLAFTLLRELAEQICLFLWPVLLEDFEVGDCLDICDYRGIWYGVEKTKDSLRVRYPGWWEWFGKNILFTSADGPHSVT